MGGEGRGEGGVRGGGKEPGSPRERERIKEKGRGGGRVIDYTQKSRSLTQFFNGVRGEVTHILGKLRISFPFLCVHTK